MSEIYPPTPVSKFCVNYPFFKKGKMFGAQDGDLPYKLRQARYNEIAQNLSYFAWRHHQDSANRLNLLDVGVNDGILRRYTELYPGSEYIQYNAADLYTDGTSHVYLSTDWTHYTIDLHRGLPEIPSEAYDVVVCEQVLEHLHQYSLAMSELSRVIKPGGVLVVGVPIFPEGLHWIRKHIIPKTDKIFRSKKIIGHVQAWSKRTFLNDLRQHCPDLTIEACYGFRIISGGILRPLERCRWWWQWNRFVGQWLPGLCIEIQVVARKKK